MPVKEADILPELSLGYLIALKVSRLDTAAALCPYGSFKRLGRGAVEAKM